MRVSSFSFWNDKMTFWSDDITLGMDMCRKISLVWRKKDPETITSIWRFGPELCFEPNLIYVKFWFIRGYLILALD